MADARTAIPVRCGDGARCGLEHLGFDASETRRSERDPSGAAERARLQLHLSWLLESGRGARALPASDLYVPQAVDARPGSQCVRCTQRRCGMCSTDSIQHTLSGLDQSQRADLCRSRRGLGDTDLARIRRIRCRAHRESLSVGHVAECDGSGES